MLDILEKETIPTSMENYVIFADLSSHWEFSTILSLSDPFHGQLTKENRQSPVFLVIQETRLIIHSKSLYRCWRPRALAK